MLKHSRCLPYRTIIQSLNIPLVLIHIALREIKISLSLNRGIHNNHSDSDRESHPIPSYLLTCIKFQTNTSWILFIYTLPVQLFLSLKKPLYTLDYIHSIWMKNFIRMISEYKLFLHLKQNTYPNLYALMIEIL